MTKAADIKLLPLPKAEYRLSPDGEPCLHDNETLTDYARTNMAPLLAEIEALRAEVERLQEVVRPKREDECLTLDHWRMRAYYLEANWSRCSRACAVEQTKREQAEACAERLAEALRWAERHCPCGARPESPTTHPHIPGCPVGTALHPTAAQEEGNGQ